MAKKKNKVYYAPKTWVGVFPAIVAFFVIVSIGSLVFLVASPAVNAYGYNATSDSLTKVARAEAAYHDKNNAYTTDLSKLNVKNPALVELSILGVCPTGWVASAKFNGDKDAYYSSSANPLPSSLKNLQFPDCLTSADLNGSLLDYQVKVTNVKVTRSLDTKKTETVKGKKKTVTVPGVGDILDGSAAKRREGIKVTWDSTNSCSAGQVPTYTVKATAQDFENKQISDDYTTPIITTSTSKTASLPDVLNGMKYAVDVSGACGTDTPAGAVERVTYTQPISKSNGILMKVNGNKYYPQYGKVSTSEYVDYQIEVRHAGGAWQQFISGINQDSVGYVKKSGYYASYGDQFRIRAYNADKTAYSAWSKASGFRYTQY